MYLYIDNTQILRQVIKTTKKKLREANKRLSLARLHSAPLHSASAVTLSSSSSSFHFFYDTLHAHKMAKLTVIKIVDKYTLSKNEIERWRWRWRPRLLIFVCTFFLSTTTQIQTTQNLAATASMSILSNSISHVHPHTETHTLCPSILKIEHISVIKYCNSLQKWNVREKNEFNCPFFCVNSYPFISFPYCSFAYNFIDRTIFHIYVPVPTVSDINILCRYKFRMRSIGFA